MPKKKTVVKTRAKKTPEEQRGRVPVQRGLPLKEENKTATCTFEQLVTAHNALVGAFAGLKAQVQMMSESMGRMEQNSRSYGAVGVSSGNACLPQTVAKDPVPASFNGAFKDDSASKVDPLDNI